MKLTCFEVNASRHISILEPLATASRPFWLISSDFGVVGAKYVCNGTSFLTSHTFTFPSIPPVTICKPACSKATAVTGPRWQRIVASGVDMFGDHMVTDPLLWPNPITELYGFMRITPLRPKWVLCCATMCPVLVSWYRNTPPLSTLANRKWCGRNSNFNGEIWSCTAHKFRHLLSHSRRTICWCKTSSPVTLLRNFSSQVCSMPTMTQQLELSVTNCTKVLVKYRHHKES